MKWQSPEFSVEEIDRAGRILIDGEANSAEREEALRVLDNWRASHAFPLNSLQMNLRGKAEKVYGSALIAQRLKRTVSIESKLRLRNWIRLSTMQDIGGCRAVLRTPAEVYRIRDKFLASRSKHELVREKDFIAEPRPESGYRSVHLVYGFAGRKPTPYDGLQIEIQLRTRLQHAWATAVETVGFLVNQGLKSNLGDSKWREFFRLAGAAFALEEKCPRVPGVDLDATELRKELAVRVENLRVDATLRALSVVLRGGPVDVKRGYYLLTLRPVGQRFELTVRGFGSGEEAQADEAYSTEQRQLYLFPQSDTVLVRVASIEALKRSYPNYYLDTRVFLERLKGFIRGR